MDHCLPDWNFDENFYLSTQRRSFLPENELVELLWRDGQVVLQSQTHRRSPPVFSNHPMINEPIQHLHQDHHHHHHHHHHQRQHHHQQTPLRTDELSCDDAFLEDQETVSWIQYPPDDPFEKEFSSNFFSATPPLDPIQPEKPSKQLEKEETLRFGGWQRTAEASRGHNTMPPPKFRVSESKTVKFGDLAKEGSAMTVGPSHCGSNQLQNDLDIATVTTTTTTTTNTTTTGFSVGSLRDNDGKDVVFMSDKCKNDDALDQNATSSSGGSSGCSFGRTTKEADASGTISGRKRKEVMETEESISQSGAAGNKSSQRSGSTRRSRAAEVHNLSERRRRDRINEKMRALQELIPHCSKTDKASILDEAIEYLKSLQLQLQVMWMGSGMAPMMFNGMQPYIPRMGMQMPSPIHNPMNFSGFPVLDRSMAQNPGLVCQNPALNPVHQFQNQPQNPVFPEQFARYIGGFPQMQAVASQPMNMMRFGSQMAQQSQAPAPTGGVGGGGPVTVGGAAATTDNLPISK